MEVNMLFLHLLAGIACGQENTCGGKIRHKNERNATRHAEHLNESAISSHRVEPYPCGWCFFWHVGREMSLKELKKWAAKAQAAQKEGMDEAKD